MQQRRVVPYHVKMGVWCMVYENENIFTCHTCPHAPLVLHLTPVLRIHPTPVLMLHLGAGTAEGLTVLQTAMIEHS